jgi:imidazolonepropionase-like amidohydrolase
VSARGSGRAASFFAVVGLVAALGAVPSSSQADADAQRDVAIVHANAWTMASDAPMRDATIVVVGGRVRSVVASGAVPAGVRVIDAKGANVTPGFYNAATQIGLTEITGSADTRDLAAKSASIGPSFDVSTAVNGNSPLVSLARSDGLTGATSYPSSSGVPPFAGLAAALRLRMGADVLDRAGVAEFVTISGAGNAEHGSRAAQWQRLRLALEEARTPPPADRATLSRADAEVLRRVLAGKVPLAITTDRESDVRQAIRLVDEFRLRVIIVGGAEAWRAATDLARARIPVVLDPHANLPSTFDQLGTRADNAALLARAGVRVAFGNVGGRTNFNFNAGIALREGAGLAVSNGLPYVEAMRAVTTTAREIFGETGEGRIAPGSRADLVIWDGDPFEPATNVVTLFIDGVEIAPENRQTALARRYSEKR